MKKHNKTEKIIITGSSGSGKDWLMRQLEKEGLKVSVKTTTRPQRKNEVQSVTYNFINDGEFQSLLENNQFICHQSFYVTPAGRDPENWHYGISKEEFDKSQAFIMTPGEILQIDEVTRKGCFVVYLDIDRTIRESRICGRNDFNDSVKRRLDADEKDFFEFFEYDLKITDPEFDYNMVLDLMY
jgi:guanylate kinase